MTGFNRHDRQRGAVLITALVLLLVLTLLGLSAIQTTTLEERMAGNYRSGTAAFEAAESALREGESTVGGFTTRPLPKSDGATGVWVLDSPDPDASKSEAWWREASASWWGSTNNIGSYTKSLEFVSGKQVDPPHYLIEEVGLIKDSLNVGQSKDENGRYFYQITARGTGVNQNSISLLRSVYARRY